MSKSAALFRASNVIALDYPLDGALVSALSVCDEAIVIVDKNSRDNTLGCVYDLQKKHGADRVAVLEKEWEFDRSWQERVWAWAAAATTAEWLMFHDADEAIHESDAAEIRTLMSCNAVHMIRFPFIHLFATPAYRAHFELTHNTRLGRRSIGYRMRNWCTDEQPQRAACQMVYGDDEYNAHLPNIPGLVTIDAPMMHYGWCRAARALAISQKKQHAWYADGAGLQDGRIPDIPAYDFNLKHQLEAGFVTRYDGLHPAGMREWFAEHNQEWSTIDE